MWLFSNKRYQHTTYKIVHVIVHGMAAASLEFDTLLGVMWRFASFQIANALLLSSSLLALCLSGVAFIPCHPVLQISRRPIVLVLIVGQINFASHAHIGRYRLVFQP